MKINHSTFPFIAFKREYHSLKDASTHKPIIDGQVKDEPMRMQL